MLPEGHMDLSEFILRIGEHALPPSKIQYSVEHYCTYHCKQSNSSVHPLLSTVHNICGTFNKTFSNLSIGKYDCRRNIYKSHGRILTVLTHLYEQSYYWALLQQGFVRDKYTAAKKNSINFFMSVELKLFINKDNNIKIGVNVLINNVD